MTAPHPTFAVPAGTPEAQCRGCGAPIYWIRTALGKRMPVDCDADGCLLPSGRGAITPYEGLGISHFATCVEADRFRRTR